MPDVNNDKNIEANNIFNFLLFSSSNKKGLESKLIKLQALLTTTSIENERLYKIINDCFSEND